MELQDWLSEYLESQAEVVPEFVASIEQGEADLQEGRCRVPSNLTSGVPQATAKSAPTPPSAAMEAGNISIGAVRGSTVCGVALS